MRKLAGVLLFAVCSLADADSAGGVPPNGDVAPCPAGLATDLAGRPAAAALARLQQLVPRCPAMARDALAVAELATLHEDPSLHRLLREHPPQGGEVVMVPGDEPGRSLRIAGLVTDAGGRPVADALVYLFHTDASGVYTRSGAVGGLRPDQPPRLFAYLRTDAGGRFAVRTIRPARYPGSRIQEHVHVQVEADGHRPLVSELVFGDDEVMTAEQQRRAEGRGWVVCAPVDEGDAQRCRLPLALAD